ncbi:hypothetical protein DAI22_11g202701 [Oryza sativa Japonica Group]|nr:hypothetical protein DAI22_11g202701 [Oryza sativa Japonica Group]
MDQPDKVNRGQHRSYLTAASLGVQGPPYLPSLHALSWIHLIVYGDARAFSAFVFSCYSCWLGSIKASCILKNLRQLCDAENSHRGISPLHLIWTFS